MLSLGGLSCMYVGISIMPGSEPETFLPRVKAPWYGYMLFQAAAAPKAAEASNLGPSATVDGTAGRFATIKSAAATPACEAGQVKIWPVVHNTSYLSQISGVKKELRVVVLNKNDESDCLVTLKLSEGFQDASLTRVQAEDDTGLAAQSVLWGGQKYEWKETQLSGTPVSELVVGVLGGDGNAEELPKPSRKLRGCEGGTSYTFMMPKASAALLVSQSKAEGSC
jgi:hypothetical protein